MKVCKERLIVTTLIWLNKIGLKCESEIMDEKFVYYHRNVKHWFVPEDRANEPFELKMQKHKNETMSTITFDNMEEFYVYCLGICDFSNTIERMIRDNVKVQWFDEDRVIINNNK